MRVSGFLVVFRWRALRVMRPGQLVAAAIDSDEAASALRSASHDVHDRSAVYRQEELLVEPHARQSASCRQGIRLSGEERERCVNGHQELPVVPHVN